MPWPFPAGGVREFYREVSLPAIERGDEWSWTLRLKVAPEQLIGAISLYRSARENRGFWLGLAWQGQGLMTEAVLITTDYWFDVLRFPVLRATKASSNHASVRISERTGMRRVATKERDSVSGRLVAESWEITADEWGAKRATIRDTMSLRRRRNIAPVSIG